MNREHDKWTTGLIKNINGSISCCTQNLFMIFDNDPSLANLRFNEKTGRIEVGEQLPWSHKGSEWSALDTVSLNAYLEDKYGLYYPHKVRDSFLAFIASRRAYNPINDYLNSLKWDGVPRVETLLIDYMGAEDTNYVRTVTRKTMVAAVARTFEPGVKFDNVLILCGKQGIGKSTLFARLGKKYFSDSLSVFDMKDKTAAEKMQGIWIMELSELSGLKRIDAEIIKAFVSRTDDRYRAAYSQYVESHPRSGIIVGSCNSRDGFLTDPTGNRRFWPIEVYKGNICNVFDLTEQDIDMLWAEAVEMYCNGETLYLDEKLALEAELIQQANLETDPKQGIVDEYLEGCNEKVCIIQIWCDCFEKPRSDIKKKDSVEIEQMICKNGNWVPYSGNKEGKLRFCEYGVQRAFVRTDRKQELCS